MVICDKYAKENPNQEGGKYFFIALQLFSVEVECHMVPSSVHVVVTHTALPILLSEKQNWCAQGWTEAISEVVKFRMYRRAEKHLPSEMIF